MSILRIIFAGSGEFGVPTLRALHAVHEIVYVATQPDRPAGRGRGLTPTPLAAAAEALGLQAVRTADFNREILPPADVMVVVAFGQKIADAPIHHPRLGSVNLHASRLPKYRGAAPINWAILRGETVAGNSIIRLAKRMDAGAVLGQSTLPIGELETAGELHDRLAIDGAALMSRAVDDLAAGRAVETPQDESQATLAPKLSRGSSKLEWTRPAAKLSCQIRGLSPWPGCRVRLIDSTGAELGRARLVRACPAAASSGSPGEIDANGNVRAGDGAVEIVELQPDGRTPMPLADYRRGRKWEAGMRVESIVD